MPLKFDSIPPLRMDAGLKLDSEPASSYQPKLKNKTMSKFKLELKNKKPADKLVMGTTHITSMDGNTNYPQEKRAPTDAQVLTAQGDLQTAHNEVKAAEVVWKGKIQTRDEKEAIWDTIITARAANCEAVTPNNLPALASTGFPMRSAGGPVGELPAPENLRATASNIEGSAKLRCKPVQGASSYEWECRLHEGSPPWQAIKPSTAASITATSLTPGALYAFRVRALGSAGPGAWSDEAVLRAT